MPSLRAALLAGAGVTVLAAAPVLADVRADIADCRRLTSPAEAERAEQVCGRALTATGVSDQVRAALLTVRGESLFQLSRFDAAIQDFDAVLALDANNHVAWLGRGKSRVRLGEYALAIQDLDQALALQGSDDRALYWTGEALMGAGQADAALTFYSEALVASRGNATYLRARAQAHNVLGNADLALADYEAAARAGGAPVTRELQSYLQAKGHYAGAVDGVYGPATAKALQACIADPTC